MSPTSSDLMDAIARVDQAFRQRYRSSISEFAISDVPGYWRHLVPCGGASGGCREPVHGCVFSEGPIYHTVSYFDVPRIRGRFASPTRTWKLIKESSSCQ